jgi:hypothetical protein
MLNIPIRLHIGPVTESLGENPGPIEKVDMIHPRII